MGLTATAMAPAIEANHLVVSGQRLNDARDAPLELAVDGKAVNEENGVALTFDGVMNLDAVGIEEAIVGGITVRGDENKQTNATNRHPAQLHRYSPRHWKSYQSYLRPGLGASLFKAGSF